MKRRSTGLLVGFLFAGFAVSAIPSHAAEFRGLWVDAFHPGFKSPTETTEMVAKAKDAGFNALFVQVRKRGDAYYMPTIEPRANDLPTSYDPLADVIDKGHKAGLEVHAWVSVLDVFLDSEYYNAGADHVVTKHPEWLMHSKDKGDNLVKGKMMLDPGVPEVRDYTVAVLLDIVSRYDIDGLHLDNIRYLGDNTGYNPTSVSLFNTQNKRSEAPDEDDPVWKDWRRQQVTQLLRQISQATKTAKPQVKISASVFGDRSIAYDDFFQDWGAWMKEGLLDFAVSMAFAKDDKLFRQAVDDDLSAVNGRSMYIGLGAWRLPVQQAIGQMDYARSKGAQGLVVYSYAYCSKVKAGQSISFMDALKGGPFAQSKAVTAEGSVE